jgi:two-component system chemotaxis sensor kinase CheA
MAEESSPPDNQEQLREKAILLLHREREIFAMRAKHQQVTRWLKVAQSLPRLLTDRKPSMLETYELLRKTLISGLRLQRVLLLEIGEGVLRPLAPSGPERPLGHGVAALLQARATGFCNEPTEPDVTALAEEIGMYRFIWSSIRPTGKALVLLVAGFDRAKAAFQPAFDEGDAAHIENTAQHIETLLGNAFLVSELEREKVNRTLENRDSELLAATEQLRAANENLERRVRERTEELAQRSRDMRLVLDNVGQALLTIDSGGRLAQERSAIVDRWFGPYEGQPLFSEYIGEVDPAFAQEFVLGYEALLEDILPREVCLRQLPRRLRDDQRELCCTYFPLLAGEVLTGLLIVVDDVTEKILRDRDGAEQSELLALFQGLMNDRSGYLAFIEDTQGIIDVLAKEGLDDAERRGLLHTLKGTAAVVGVNVIAGLCHRAEDEMAEGATDQLKATIARLWARWADIMESMSAVIKVHGHGMVEVSLEELERLSEEVRRGASQQTIIEQFALWQLEPIERPLLRLGQHAHALAKRLGKGTIAVTVESPDVRLDAKRFGNFWPTLIHVVRNAVDHGLETPEEREASGKPSEGHLSFRAVRDDRHLTIEISDDGRGVDWERVRYLAAERGLAHDRPEDMLQALLEPGFTTRCEITATSGRGVGMSAVHDQIKKLGGTIALSSEPGLGTRWCFSFPRSVAHEAYASLPPSTSKTSSLAPLPLASQL